MGDLPGVPRKEINEALDVVVNSQVVLTGDLDISIAYLESIKTQYPQYTGFTLVPIGPGFGLYGHVTQAQVAVMGRRLENDEEYNKRTKKKRDALIEKARENLAKRPLYEILIKKIDLALGQLSS